MNKYDVILADPPWSYRDIGMDWAAKEGTKYKRSVMNHYGVMAIDEICALPVQDLMAENCACFCGVLGRTFSMPMLSWKPGDFAIARWLGIGLN